MLKNKSRVDIEKYILSALQDKENVILVKEKTVDKAYFQPGTHRDLFRLSVEYYNKFDTLLTPDILAHQARDFKFNRQQISNLLATFKNVRSIKFDNNEVPFYIEKLKNCLAGDILKETLSKVVGVSKEESGNSNLKAIEELVKLSGESQSILESDAIVRKCNILEVEAMIKDEIWERKHNPESYSGIMAGIKEIDDAFGSGLGPGELTVFMAPPGGGKTTMMLCVADAIWRNSGKNVVYVSLEMSVNKMAMKHISANSAVPSKELESGNIKKKDKGKLDQTFDDRRKASENANFEYWDIASTGKVKVSVLENEVRKSLPYGQIDVLVVDYLECLSYDYGGKEDYWIQMGDICKFLRGLGRKYGMTIISAIQLKREAISRIRKSKDGEVNFGADDAQGSNQISADADRIYALIIDDKNNRFMKLFTAKNRHGDGGYECSLFFDGSCSRIFGDDTNYNHDELYDDREFNSIISKSSSNFDDLDDEEEEEEDYLDDDFFKSDGTTSDKPDVKGNEDDDDFFQ